MVGNSADGDDLPPIKESSDELNPAVAVAANEIPAPRKRRAGDYVALAIATCGVGFFPIAPGTLGSLVGVAIFLTIRSVTSGPLDRFAVTRHWYYFQVEAAELALALATIMIISLAGI